MKDTYVHAVLELIQAGQPIETVLQNLKKVLVTRGHMKLHAAILANLAIKLELLTKASQPKIVLASTDGANEADIKKALSKLSAPEQYAVTVNPNIIGGLIATYKSKQLDQSYQTKLRELYQSIITA